MQTRTDIFINDLRNAFAQGIAEEPTVALAHRLSDDLMIFGAYNDEAQAFEVGLAGPLGYDREVFATFETLDRAATSLRMMQKVLYYVKYGQVIDDDPGYPVTVEDELLEAKLDADADAALDFEDLVNTLDKIFGQDN